MKTPSCRCALGLLAVSLFSFAGCSSRSGESPARERKAAIALELAAPALYSEEFESGTAGWADAHKAPPPLLTDASSPAGPTVMAINRARSGGDYFSPWIMLTGGETYCAKVAIQWSGKGAMPFVGIQPWPAAEPTWIIGSTGARDTFGPLQGIDADNPGWQQLEVTLRMPQTATRARFAAELYAPAGRPGKNAAAFDGFSLRAGACQALPGVPYSEAFEAGAGGWADARNVAPALLTDASSPAGPTVMAITRARSGGDYFSPWIALTGGGTYCAKVAIKWSGKGAMPFVGIQAGTAWEPAWIVGSAKARDAFGPLQGVSLTDADWQQFEVSIAMPDSATRARFATELFAPAGRPGRNAAFFDGFSLSAGACGSHDAGVADASEDATVRLDSGGPEGPQPDSTAPADASAQPDAASERSDAPSADARLEADLQADTREDASVRLDVAGDAGLAPLVDAAVPTDTTIQPDFAGGPADVVPDASRADVADTAADGVPADATSAADAATDGPRTETVVVTSIATSTMTGTKTTVAGNTQTVTGTALQTASGTVTASYAGTETDTVTSSGTVISSTTVTGTATWTGTYSGVGTAAGTILSFTRTATGTTTLQDTLTVYATGTDIQTATETVTGSSVTTASMTATQTFSGTANTTITQTATSTQTVTVVVREPAMAGVACGGGRGPLSSLIVTDHVLVDPLPALNNQTVRVMLESTIGGSQVAVKLTNRFSAFPISIGGAHLALKGSGGAIVSGTDSTMTFDGAPGVDLAPGQEVWSDPVTMGVVAGQTLAISIYTPSKFTPTTEAGRGNVSWMTHYISSAGNWVSSTTMPSGSTTHTILFVAEIRVLPPSPAVTLAALGDSITESACSTATNGDWPDLLSTRLSPLPDGTLVSVFNAGIGSGRFVTSDAAGLRGLARLPYLLTLPNVRWVTLLMGVNDISYDHASAADLIAAYQTAIAMAHAAGVKIIGIPILPFRHSVKDVGNNWAVAQEVNAWIRTAGNGYDAIIDFEPVLGDPNDPGSLLASLTCDHVHPNQAGYTAMANAIDLSIFR